MAASGSVEVTTTCADPRADTLLLPAGSGWPGRLVLTANGKDLLVHGGVRSDAGEAACIDGSLQARIGGAETVIYRPATIGDVLRLDRDVILQLAITALTLGGAIFTGLVSFVIDRHDTNPWKSKTAFAIFLIGTVLAALKAFQEVRKAQA